MNSKIIKKDNLEFIKYFPFTLPSMGWYFSSKPPKNSIKLQPDIWTCIFKYINKIANGEKICFSINASACKGAECYFGFTHPSKKAGYFLSFKEKFKKKLSHANEFYNQIKAKKPKSKYLILSSLKQIKDDISIEVVNYWVNPLILSGLITLCNFASYKNNNVKIPFASGCQSMWTMPYKEKDKKYPNAIIGALDPAMRKYIAYDTMLFSVSAKHFNNLAKDIKNSFAMENNWLSLMAL